MQRVSPMLLIPQMNMTSSFPFGQLGYVLCGKGEGVRGVLTLFGRGKAQVCHDLRVVELREQLDVEEEDSDRQEEKEEVEREKSNQGECAMLMTVGDNEMRSELEPWDVKCETITTVEQMRSACRLSACTPRVR